MTPDQLAQFKQALIKACDAHLATGGKIIFGGYKYDDKQCPITCLMGVDSCGPYGFDNVSLLVKDVLGFEASIEELGSFIRGFDLNPPSSNNDDQDCWQLGKDLHAKYSPQCR